MNAQEKRTTSRCNKLHELPTVVTDGQQTAWCPDCDYYDGGMCNSVSRIANAACPFDGKLLPLREVPAGSGKFSSDRTIAEYAADIWKVTPCPVG